MRSDCHVTRVVLDKNGRRAVGIEYFDNTGTARIQHAKVIVLAAFSIETPRILLNSADESHPDGVGNSSGLLGRYLMSHLSVGITGMFPDYMQNYLGATGGQLLCQDHFPKDAIAGAFGSRQWEIALALKPNDLLGIAMTRPEIIGPELGKFMKAGAAHLGSMVGVCEDLPVPENRVGLAQERDRFGFRLAKVTYKYGTDAWALWKAASQEGVAIFKAAGATDAWPSPPTGQHIMGGCVMGKDASKSVTDADCRLHDVDNIFIGGPGVFPTASCVNSTFTVHAVAMKSAKAVLREWTGIAS